MTRDERINLWGEGPWIDEPDRVEWRTAGLPCLVRRGISGALCGYVAVPPEHPYHGKHYGEVDELLAPGGVNYSALCNGDDICHVPEPGEPDNVFWFGFDCGHMGQDFVPAFARSNGVFGSLMPEGLRQRMFDVEYRTFEFVRDATEFLAQQLANAAKEASEPWRCGVSNDLIARGVLRALIAYRSEWIGDERAKPNPDAAAIERWRAERSKLAARLRVPDVSEVDIEELSRLVASESA